MVPVVFLSDLMLTLSRHFFPVMILMTSFWYLVICFSVPLLWSFSESLGLQYNDRPYLIFEVKMASATCESARGGVNILVFLGLLFSAVVSFLALPRVLSMLGLLPLLFQVVLCFVSLLLCLSPLLLSRGFLGLICCK